MKRLPKTASALPFTMRSSSSGYSSGLYSRSASWTTITSPAASAIPRRTAAPLPRFFTCRTCLNPRRVGHEGGRVTGTPGADGDRHLASRHALGRAHHLAHGPALARAQVQGLEPAVGLEAQRGHVGAGEVLHVDVVADAGAVRRLVV